MRLTAWLFTSVRTSIDAGSNGPDGWLRFVPQYWLSLIDTCVESLARARLRELESDQTQLTRH